MNQFSSCPDRRSRAHGPAVHRIGPFVREPENHHARPVQHAQREDVAKVEVERQNHRTVHNGPLNQRAVLCRLHPDSADVDGLMTEFEQEADSLR